QVAEVERPRVLPDVAGIHEDHAAQIPPDWRADLRGRLDQRMAADRLPLEERRDVEPSPSAKAGGAPQPVAPVERDLQVCGTEVADRAGARLHGEHPELPERQEVAPFQDRLEE